MTDRYPALFAAFPLGRLFRTQVRVSFLFIAVAIIFGFRFGWELGLVLTGVLFVSTLVHEFGHVTLCPAHRRHGGRDSRVAIGRTGARAAGTPDEFATGHRRRGAGRESAVVSDYVPGLSCAGVVVGRAQPVRAAHRQVERGDLAAGPLAADVHRQLADAARQSAADLPARRRPGDADCARVALSRRDGAPAVEPHRLRVRRAVVCHRNGGRLDLGRRGRRDSADLQSRA